MNSCYDNPAREEIRHDVAREMPTLWSATWASKQRPAIWRLCLLAMMAVWVVVSGWVGIREMLLIGGLFALAEAGRWWLFLLGLRLFSRRSLEGWEFTEHEGLFVATRNGVERCKCALSECHWCQIPNLKAFLKNMTFPDRGVTVVFPGKPSAMWLFSDHPFFVCGLTDVSSAMWRDRLLANGAPETTVDGKI